jgi:hypothetical protein
MSIIRTLICLALVSCVPPSQLPGSSTPSCDGHATALGDTCQCDAGYHGDGTSCEADDTGPTCDIHASRIGDTCQCDIGYSGTGVFCSQDSP